jgi:hypothetical protein
MPGVRRARGSASSDHRLVGVIDNTQRRANMLLSRGYVRVSGAERVATVIDGVAAAKPRVRPQFIYVNYLRNMANIVPSGTTGSAAFHFDSFSRSNNYVINVFPL